MLIICDMSWDKYVTVFELVEKQHFFIKAETFTEHLWNGDVKPMIRGQEDFRRIWSGYLASTFFEGYHERR